MKQPEIEAVCQRIYGETKAFYSGIADDCKHAGYSVLYGPPTPRPAVLILGYQPGGKAYPTVEENLKKYGEPADRWPDTLWYLDRRADCEPLAKRLRSMFGDVLHHAVGLNALFFRSPRIKEYEVIDGRVRKSISAFCLPRVCEIIAALEPAKIVVVGFRTLDLFGPFTSDRTNAQTHRVLTRTGTIAGRPAIATLHLSGARISSEDRRLIAERVLEFRG